MTAEKMAAAVTAAGAGSTQAVRTIPGISADDLATMVTAAGAGSTQGVGYMLGVTAATIASMVTAAGAGSTQGVGSIPGIDSSTMTTMVNASNTQAAGTAPTCSEMISSLTSAKAAGGAMTIGPPTLLCTQIATPCQNLVAGILTAIGSNYTVNAPGNLPANVCSFTKAP